jgi:hypothetical protein
MKVYRRVELMDLMFSERRVLRHARNLAKETLVMFLKKKKFELMKRGLDVTPTIAAKYSQLGFPGLLQLL